MYPPSCLGMSPPDYNPMGECAEGYKGLACSDCEKGYYRLSTFECKECPDFTSYTVVFAVLLFLVLLFFLIVIKLAYDASKDKIRKLSIYLRIVVDHLHLIIFIGYF